MANIDGTAGADLLFGAAPADLISGGDGNDVIYGGAGDDDLRGGEGNDELRGESGNDRLDGGAGNDIVTSTDTGNDILIGGEGDDTLFVNRVRAGDALTLDGGGGNDRLVIQLSAAAAALTASAGAGDDTVDIFALRSTLGLSLGTGRDLVSLIDFRTSVQGGGRIVVADFEAGTEGDRISFSSLTSFDFTNWDPNTNPFGTGYLKAVQSGADVVISASFTANGTFVDAIVLQNMQLSSLTPENLGGWTWDGSPIAPLLIFATDAAETLRGNGGDDTIWGQGGDDILEGHAGNDYLYGGDGNDILRGGQGYDILHGGAGNDVLSSESAGEGLYGEDGDDRLAMAVASNSPTAGSIYGSGGAGNDTISISGASANASFGVDAGAGDDLVSITALTNSAVITLGDGRDRIDIDNWIKSASNSAVIDVTDFATGDGGDRLEWSGFQVRNLGGWIEGPMLFANGYARLQQSGADVLLQFDRNGGGDQYVTLVTFRNTSAAAFTSYNLGGLGAAGFPADGATVTGTAASETLFGTDGDDVVEGLDGNDLIFGFHGDDDLRGGAGDDILSGYDGDDVLEGGDGNDVFNAGRGEDLIDGGEGDDVLNDSGSGSKGFVGGAGNDSVYYNRFNSSDLLVASGGDGVDYFSIQNSSSAGYIVDGGAGNDIFDLAGYGQVALGSGQDLLRFTGIPFFQEPPMLVVDLAAGDSGDRLEFSQIFNRFNNFNPSANPFSTGHLLLTTGGSNTYLMADLDGPGGGSPIFLAVLQGVDRLSLTSHNLGGYATPWTVGTGASETFQGDGGLNEFIGGGGNDTFLLGYGGNDVAVGGTGDDLFYAAVGISGPSSGPMLTITGGGGSDILQIQGKSADSRLILMNGFGGGSYETIKGAGIATVQLLSGFDSSRGWALGAPVKYSIVLDDGFAPTGAPLVIDTTRLAASESFSIDDDSTPDPDAIVTLIGGAGADRVKAGRGGTYLDGGDGNDELYTGAGSDTLLGGSGSDRLYSNLTDSRSGTDYLDGGDGDDTISLTGGLAGLWSTSTIKGGADNDLLTVDVQGGPGVANADLGAGNDRVQLRSASGTFNLTLGAGSDTVEILPGPSGGISVGTGVSIADFVFGAGGDVLVWQSALNAYLAGSYSGGMNPFQSGHARLVQDGGDVLLQLSRVADGNYLTLLRFQGHVLADFDGGIGGFLPSPPNGTPGDDILIGTDGRDDFDGGAGNDVIDGRGGADRMAGGSGDDIFYVDDVSDQVVESYQGGIDEIRTSLPVYKLANEFENLRGTSNGGQTLTGNEEANRLTGGAGNDVLDGNGGGDILDGGPGADRMEGGSGNDIFYVDDSGDVVTDTGNSVFDEVRTSLAAYSLVGMQVEHLTATSDVAHLFRGNDNFNILTGGAGNDILLLQDGGGADSGHGGAGNDVIYFGSGIDYSDLADGGPGRDAVVFQGNVTAVLNDLNLISIESISLQSGANATFGDTANNFYDFNITTSDGNVAAGQQLIVNGQSLRVGEDFTFNGSAEHDGRFLIYGGHGLDTLKGGDGVDVFFFEGQRWGSGDKVDGGAGRDSLVISAGSGMTHIEFAADSLTNIESISVNNLFATDPSQKPSYGLVLANGNVAAGGTLIVNGSSLPGGQVVNIDGHSVHDGNLILFGGGGHDVLTGGDGADLILGGGGADALTGGAGADTFRYDAASDSAGFADLIGDFQSGVDKIDLTRIDANTLVGGDQAFAWIGTNAFSGAAGELRTYEADGYRWVAGDTNGDGGADFAIAFYPASAPQGPGDFLF